VIGTLEYAIGAAAAIGGAAAINFGTALQKRALAAASPPAGLLLPSLFKNRLWLAGFALQACIGGPLTVAAMSLIGPSATPGLMAAGLIVLAVASRRINHERMGKRSAAGIGLVAVAVALIAWSALTVDLSAHPFPGSESSEKFAVMLASLIAFTALCAMAGAALLRRSDKRGAVSLAIGAGSVSAIGNLLLGLVSGALRGVLGGAIDVTRAPAVLASLAALSACSLVNMALTQHALRAAKASTVAPVIQVPIQITPIVAFFAVYRPFDPGPFRTAVGLLGVLGSLAGAALLSSTEA
jgi:drug/metabolite transporter (DMT)-like permease